MKTIDYVPYYQYKEDELTQEILYFNNIYNELSFWSFIAKRRVRVHLMELNYILLTVRSRRQRNLARRLNELYFTGL